MVNGLSQYDMNIAFKLHNIVQMTFYHQCILQYLHLLKSICRARYIEHEIFYIL
jgi:hypothetical protein